MKLNLDGAQWFALWVTIVLIILCIVLGIIAWVKENHRNGLLLHDPFWYSDRTRSTALAN